MTARTARITPRLNSDFSRLTQLGPDTPTRSASSLLRTRPSCCNSESIFRSTPSSWSRPAIAHLVLSPTWAAAKHGAEWLPRAGRRQEPAWLPELIPASRGLYAGLKQGCPGPGAAKASPGIRCWTGEAFSEGGKPGHDASLDACPPSMRPGLAAAEREIVGIGDRTAHRFLRLDHLVGDALALAIGDGFLLAVEAQRDLLLHVAGRGPTHQRLDRARLLGLVVELPFLGLRPAGLHRVLGGLENACGHGWSGPLVRLFVRFRCVTVAVGGNRGHSIETPFGN